MRSKESRKGVSPLIAAVLLIAFTMAVAAILTAWVTTFTQQQTQQLGNQSEKQIDCSFGQIEIFDTQVGGNSPPYSLVVAVTNTGTLNFNETRITVLSGGSVLNTTTIPDLNSGSTKSRNVTGIQDAPEAIRISTNKCPTVSATANVG